MKFLCAPEGLSDPWHPVQGICDMAAGGFSGTVLDGMLFSENRRGDSVEMDGTAAEQFAVRCRAEGLALPLAYAPYFREEAWRGSSHTRHFRTAADYLADAKRCISLCKALGTPALVVRPLQEGIAREQLWAENRAFYLALAEESRAAGVRLLLCNRARSIGGHLVRGVCAEVHEAVSWVDALNEAAGEERFAFALDMTASAPFGQALHGMIHALGARLHAVLACDSDAAGTKALLPFSGADRGLCGTDWQNVIRALRETHFDGLFVLSMRDTAASFPPLLRPALMKLAKAVLDYFVWQIEMEKSLARYGKRVLFGAGRMCRNYLAAYGKAYPPLFTCDNNAALWGKEVDGLSVRPPKDLLALPADCAIFICNLFYRDIEAQIRAMGVQNPIAYFNDECLSRLYTGRLLSEVRR
ncbi:MAG: sugar phosphate isomerase/epimerase family protein [Mitsuokella sp.]